MLCAETTRTHLIITTSIGMIIIGIIINACTGIGSCIDGDGKCTAIRQEVTDLLFTLFQS